MKIKLIIIKKFSLILAKRIAIVPGKVNCDQHQYLTEYFKNQSVYYTSICNKYNANKMELIELNKSPKNENGNFLERDVKLIGFGCLFLIIVYTFVGNEMTEMCNAIYF